MIATRSFAVVVFVAVVVSTSWAALLREQPNPDRSKKFYLKIRQEKMIETRAVRNE